ncbi:MAG TPA: tryptophan--tRNA ligase [Candidatus Acidoferrales bacterium]
MAPKRKRVLSGMRPTGRLHIGHYFGALANWIRMQEEYDSYHFVADWHALTSDYADTSGVAQNTIEIVTDWLAAGLDPNKCTMFLQSSVPEHAELHLLLSMITPLGWLERVPTYKEQLDNVKDKDLHTYGFLGYPVLQSADIVIYDADFVPVGEDQAPHVELTREIVRRFNSAFGDVAWKRVRAKSLKQLFMTEGPAAGSEVEKFVAQLADTEAADRESSEAVTFLRAMLHRLSLDERLSRYANAKVPLKHVLVEPRVLLTETPRIPGTDGRKMSKSYNNFISLSEDDGSIRQKARMMMTDPARKRRTDPGNPEVCPVFSWHKLFSPPETIAWSDQGCRTAGIGCIECKDAMAGHLIKWIEPLRALRMKYESKPGQKQVWEILNDGSSRARKTAKRTMKRVREAIFAWERSKKNWGAGKPPQSTTTAGN